MNSRKTSNQSRFRSARLRESIRRHQIEFGVEVVKAFFDANGLTLNPGALGLAAECASDILADRQRRRALGRLQRAIDKGTATLDALVAKLKEGA